MEELRKVWHALDDNSFGRILKLVILTEQRRVEIGGLRCSEINFTEQLITIPAIASRMQENILFRCRLQRWILFRRARAVILVFGRGKPVHAGWSKFKFLPRQQSRRDEDHEPLHRSAGPSRFLRVEFSAGSVGA